MSKHKLTDEQQANKEWLRSLEIVEVRVLACQLGTKAPWKTAKIGALMTELCRYKAITTIRKEMKDRTPFKIRYRIAA